MRLYVTALAIGAAALAITTLSPVLGNLSGESFSQSAQAAENHNSSRSNRTQTSVRPGDTGTDNKASVGIKEERKK